MKQSLDTLYFRRPTLEYAQAFDLAANQLFAGPGPALAVISSPMHAVELLKRHTGILAIAGTGDFDVSTYATNAVGCIEGSISVLDLRNAKEAFTKLVWAEPEAESAFDTARMLTRSAKPGARMDVVVSSTLRGFLPAWQGTPLPARRPLLPGQVTRLLRASGWQIERQIVFHGPRATAWSMVARACAALGRHDWSDRCLMSMRAAYRDPYWTWPLAPLALIRARLG